MRIILVLSAAGLLASCGSPDEGTIATEDGGEANYKMSDNEGGSTITFSDGEGGEMTMRTGDQLDTALPEGFTLPDGASITASADISEGEGTGQLITFTSTGSVDDIIAGLRSEAEAAGYAINTQMTSGGLQMIAGETADGANFSAQVVGEGEGATVSTTLTFSQGM